MRVLPIRHTDPARPQPGLDAPPPLRQVVLAGMGGNPRLAAGLAVLLRQALPAGQAAQVRLAEDAPDAALAATPDLLVIGPGCEPRDWLAAARRASPRPRTILLADGRDGEAPRLARRNGALLLSLAGDGATPVEELARHCADLLAPATPLPPPAEAPATPAEAPAKRRRGPEKGSRTAEQRRRAADLARALRVGELTLHYQPLVDLRSARVLGAEALARWPHPGFGNIPPNDFIPVAEQSNLILDLGAWALRDATAEAARWTNRALRVSVNVSPRQIEAGVVAGQVRAALAASRLEPHRLEVEITEGAVIDTTEATIAAIKAVRDLGVAVVLDDFGTGYASLAAARRLPVTGLKIDRSFVAGLGTHDGDLAVVRSIVDLARALKLTVVAEGVETDAQRVTLVGLGIGEGQGWLFGRPSPAAALARHLKG